MLRILLGAVMLCLSLACVAGEEGECLYNPQAFRDMLKELKHKYPKSHYAEDRRALVIPQTDGEVTVSYGGCEHYGTQLDLAANRSEAYAPKEAFARAVDLVRQFGQGRVDPKKLEKLLAKGKYEENPPGVFTVPYPLMDELTISVGQDDGQATLTVSFYN